MRVCIILTLVFSLSAPVFSQGEFTNISNGNWQNSSIWSFTGSDADGVPDSDDNVIIVDGSRVNIRNTNEACNNLTLEGRLNFPLDNLTLTVNGNMVMRGASARMTGDGATRSLIVTSGTLTIDNGASATIRGQTVTIGGTTTVNGALRFQGSTLGVKTFSSVNVSSTGSWNNDLIGEDITITGNIVNEGVWNSCPDLSCDYTLTSTSGTISGTSTTTFSDIIIDGTASYTNTGDLIVTDRLTGSGTFINGTGATFTYQGDNSAGANFDISSFTASASGNTVAYGGSTVQQLRTTTDVDNNYHNLTIDNTGGLDVAMVGDVTVDNQLTMTTGDLLLAANTLTMADGATISGGSASSYIQDNSTGVLRQAYTGSGATLSFPIGDSDDFSPITALTINSASFGADPYLEFSITDTDHPNMNTDNTGIGGDDDGTAAIANISRYWTVTASDISSPDYDVSYQYVDGDITGTESDMVGTLYRTHPTLGILDWFVTGTVNTTTNTVSLTEADAFGDLYAMDHTLNRLPVTLLSFEVTAYDGYIDVMWSTGAEENNDFFTLERSSDGMAYEPVAYQSGAGSSNVKLDYQVRDSAPLIGRSYYRLKQTDFNGTFSYSELVPVIYGNSPATQGISLVGNVVGAGDFLCLKNVGESSLNAAIYSLGGELSVKQQIHSESGGTTYLQVPSNATPGIYMLVLQKAAQRQVFKLLVR